MFDNKMFDTQTDGNNGVTTDHRKIAATGGKMQAFQRVATTPNPTVTVGP